MEVSYRKFDYVDDMKDVVEWHEARFNIWITLSRKQLTKPEKASEVKNSQAAVAEYMKSAVEANKKGGEALHALAEIKHDLAVAESYIDVLRRRIQDSFTQDRLFRKYHDRFADGVHNCIEGTELPEEVKDNPALLRLQEALESTIHEAPPDK